MIETRGERGGGRGGGDADDYSPIGRVIMRVIKIYERHQRSDDRSVIIADASLGSLACRDAISGQTLSK